MQNLSDKRRTGDKRLFMSQNVQGFWMKSQFNTDYKCLNLFNIVLTNQVKYKKHVFSYMGKYIDTVIIFTQIVWEVSR